MLITFNEKKKKAAAEKQQQLARKAYLCDVKRWPNMLLKYSIIYSI